MNTLGLARELQDFKTEFSHKTQKVVIYVEVKICNNIAPNSHKFLRTI